MRNMAEQLKENFKGTGSMESFVEQCNILFHAINNAGVEMPSGYAGKVPELSIQEGALVLDMKDAQVFSPANVKWSLTDNSSSPRSVNFDSFSATVVNGFLTIKVAATGS